ncbi:MAG TPA: tetratricopeptide repeat protein [Roseiflexaceae bacterium]|nr:tetratricopeptide repeat protein [Roseiflexaceae bacterium]HMP39973.1 tetratricopeptide repeat protein [Roseiflexaceae bacterium]
MSVNEPINFMPLDLDTFSGSERFMAGTRLGAAFSQGIRAYLRADYAHAVEHFRSALIAAYIEGEERAQIYNRERAIIYLYTGNALAFQEDWGGALHEYLEAVQTDPQLAEAHYNLGVAFAAQAKLDKAIAAFKEALEHNQQLYEAHFSLGRCYQRLDDAGRAYIHYDQACNARPQAAEPRYYMGLMHQSHGAFELAQRCFTEALRVEPTFITPEVQDDALVNRSEEEVAQWYYRLSHDLKQQGYEEEAERIYRALLQWRPQEHAARYLLGNLFARTRRLDQAIEIYRQIPSYDPHFVDARVRISTILKMQSHIREAYDVLFDCARQHPADGRLFLSMGKILYDLGKGMAAVKAFERAVQLLPHDAQAHYLLGFMYNAMGRESWALAAWRKAVELAPDAHSLRYDLGYMYVRRNRFDLAAREFVRVLQFWPDDIETNFMLGLCFKELMEPARAIPLFEKVLRRNPRHTQALYYLGACYLQIGNTSLGKAYLRRYDYLAAQEHQAGPPGRRLTPRIRSANVAG